MQRYFDREESAYSVYAEDAGAILRAMGGRFMGENPPAPYRLRGWREDGPVFDGKGVVRLDFARLLPEIPQGGWAAACADLWMSAEKKTAYLLGGDAPALFCLNGELLACRTGDGPADKIPLTLRRGRNRFLVLCRRQGAGFGCTLQNHMPQWEPYCFVTPGESRQGAAGWIWSAVSGADFWQTPELWEPDAAVPGMDWQPGAPRARQTLGGSGFLCVWCRARSLDGREGPKAAAALGKALEETPGGADCRVYVSCTPEGIQLLRMYRGAVDPRQLELPAGWQMELPVPAAGEGGRFFWLDGLSEEQAAALADWTPAGKDYLTRAVALTGGRDFWKTEYENIAVRPYAESALYGRWTYPLGVTLYGMLRTGLFCGDEAMLRYVRDFVLRVAEAEPYARYDAARYGFPGIHQQLLWLDALDDCGSFGSCLLEVLSSFPAEERRGEAFRAGEEIARRIAGYMLEQQPRREDGAFRRRDNTMWIDDIYMSVPFLVRYGTLHPASGAWDEACRQLLLYRDGFEMRGEEGSIMAHMWDLSRPEPNRIPWSRGNGWVIFSLSELLQVLPLDHPDREELTAFFRRLCAGYLALQDESGLWHQVLDMPETYLESSGSAMFLCAFCRGVRCGWLDPGLEQACRESARRAWRGLAEEAVDRRGDLYGVCQGSGWSYDRAYYAALWWNFNDAHGTGIVMLAGTEYLRMEESLRRDS